MCAGDNLLQYPVTTVFTWLSSTFADVHKTTKSLPAPAQIIVDKTPHIQEDSVSINLALPL